MSAPADLLVEIGTEELPPKALPALIAAFADGVRSGLESARLEFTAIEPFASPRRLALLVRDLAPSQPARTTEQKGPPVRIAFDEQGKPTQAAEAFARKCGVAVAELGRLATDKGEWLSHRAEEPGLRTQELAVGIVATALGALPVPRPMRWGSASTEFVRPVHWAVLLYGSDVIDGQVLGVRTGRSSRGHRFMGPAAIELQEPGQYAAALADPGFVIADFAARRERIRAAVADAAAAVDGRAVGSDALYDEVTALVEWPVALTGRFDPAFLELPREVIVSVLTAHQRYFPVEDKTGSLLPAFVTVANLESTDPERVREGNERVIRPRLADADFFWSTDVRQPLAERRAALSDVVYQQGLGTLADKADRLTDLATRIAEALNADGELAARAAALAKCDLTTSMVGEFPDLQGTMGGYYARASGEDELVAAAIEQHYWPRFAGDELPESDAAASVAIADKLDALCGSFALGKKPSGNRDPFGLRRAALGIVRIVVERGLDLDLVELIRASLAAQPVDSAAEAAGDVHDYILDRLRSYCLDRPDASAEAFDAVRARAPASLADFDARFRAVTEFLAHPAASQLAAANKRIVNILRQSDAADTPSVDEAALDEAAEKALYSALEEARDDVSPLLERRAYGEALTRLAKLQQPVDRFFDDVMVMAEDAGTRRNRLALLHALREQFLEVADISRLPVK